MLLVQHQARQKRILGYNYIPGEWSPETLTRHLMTESGMIQQVQLADGSFYPNMLFDIPNRAARVYGSPSTHSGNAAETAHHPCIMTMSLSAAHLGASSSRVRAAPIQFTDTSSTTSSTSVLLPLAGNCPEYVTLPRRPRPRMPSFSS